MKICLFTNTFLPKIGGVEFAVHYLAKNLANSGHQVSVLLHGKKSREDMNLPYKVHRYRGFKDILSAENTLALHLIFEKLRTRFEVLHAHRTYPNGYIAARLKKILKVPVILTPHGDDIQKVPEMNYGARLNFDKERKIIYALKKSDIITAISRSNRSEILSLGISKENVYDVPLGVETAQYSNSNLEIKKTLKLPESAKIIISVGVYRERKGYEYLIDAMKIVIHQHPEAMLLIIGHGTKKLSPLVKEKGLDKQIIIIEDIPEKQKPACYLGSDIFVLPSLMEAFGIVTIEAMAAGLPIIATNIPGSKDIVRNNINGFLVKPKSSEQIAEKISALLNNHALKRKFSLKSKELAQDFDWMKITGTYSNLYRKALKNRK